MDPDRSFGMGGFLPGMLGDLLKMVPKDMPLQWEMAIQFAQNVATDGQSDENPDPLERIRLEQLAQIAELHVADITGMTVAPDGLTTSVSSASRGEWARRSLESWRPVIEAIATALAPSVAPSTEPSTATSVVANEDDDAGEAELTALISTWLTAVSPMMLSMQIGSVVGHLTRHALSQYELLLPRTERASIVLVTENLAQFASDWSLEPDDLALWILGRDLTINSILSRPHVAKRLFDLLVAHAGGFHADPGALEQRLGDVSLTGMGDLGELSKLLGDPAALRQLTETPELARVRRGLAALSTTIDGYAEWVSAAVVERVSGTASRVREAMRRYRVTQSEDAKTADVLFGFPVDQHSLDRGEAFVRGVIERNGEAELARLWVVERDLPTPAEVEAPGLWLERVHLDAAGESD